MNTKFFSSSSAVFAVLSSSELVAEEVSRLAWLLQAKDLPGEKVEGLFIGPRKEIVSPWSTNATEIAVNVGISSVSRLERFLAVEDEKTLVFDRMLEAVYRGLDATTLIVDRLAKPLQAIDSIEKFNQEAGLALSLEEVAFLERVSSELGRKLTDAEVYAFSQINSEHCRHKIFNGEFVIDGVAMKQSLFSLIKDTSKVSPEYLVSAYKDNVAFIKGPAIRHFAPASADAPSSYQTQDFEAVLSLKAETHNFPTTVEPFYGASTGSGGEIRDRLAGGIGSLPLAGTAVYMTAYPRLSASRAAAWERFEGERDWKYQTPSQILIKASNGASDFGNKFGQPLICGSLLTFEGRLGKRLYAYDRCVMLAGGVGFAKRDHALKRKAEPGDVVVVLGGDNYRIGMAGGSVSSVDSGALSEELELSAVQRANPEMQKRVANAIRALCEATVNPIKLIHDHGAGGHVNCLSELLEEVGGVIYTAELPVGDPTLSLMELICNESQERMGLLLSPEDVPLLQRICARERAPMYVCGKVTGDGSIVFEAADGTRALDLPTSVLLGSSPRITLEDSIENIELSALEFSITDDAAAKNALELVLSLESVACKDWLTNKVDRCVTGLVAQQQCVGPLQLPLSDYGIVSLDFTGEHGVATALGHAPIAGLIDAAAGAELSVAEALTNIVFAPLAQGLSSVVLSANWMWPAKQSGENARLYRAVEALSLFCQGLGIAVPTGKDSLSMTMNYEDGTSVRAPGTVVVSAMAETGPVTRGVTPVLADIPGSQLLYLSFTSQREYPLGGSAFAQTLGQLGDRAPQVGSAEVFAKAFTFTQRLLQRGALLAGHDVSSGGMIVAAAEMAFAGNVGVELKLPLGGRAATEMLYSERPAVLIQVADADALELIAEAEAEGLECFRVGTVGGTQFRVYSPDWTINAAVAELRRVWFKPSYLLDMKQTPATLAKERYERFDAHPLRYAFPESFEGSRKSLGIALAVPTDAAAPVAAVIRDKGTNGEREMAVCAQLAGFIVRDVTTSDLLEGRENLEDVAFAIFPGGFSNSDVLGAGRGWAGALRFNASARTALERFFTRPDTLSLGVCNGCQLVTTLGVFGDNFPVEMQHNESGKFESIFLGVRVRESSSIMLKPLQGSELGIWVAHGEGKFHFVNPDVHYQIPLTYCSADYPANPNGSPQNAAAVCSEDGRHLAMMPHLERSMFNWNWPYRGGVAPFEVSPWMLAFQAAFAWCKAQG